MHIIGFVFRAYTMRDMEYIQEVVYLKLRKQTLQFSLLL